MDWLAPGGGEHVVVGAAPLGTYSQPLTGLALAMIPELLHGIGIDADGAGSAALGGSLDALSRDNGGRARDTDLVEVQVDVPPAEVEQLAEPVVVPGVLLTVGQVDTVRAGPAPSARA